LTHLNSAHSLKATAYLRPSLPAVSGLEHSLPPAYQRWQLRAELRLQTLALTIPKSPSCRQGGRHNGTQGLTLFLILLSGNPLPSPLTSCRQLEEVLLRSNQHWKVDLGTTNKRRPRCSHFGIEHARPIERTV